VATVRDLRDGKIRENDLIERLAGDSRVGMKKEDLQDILSAGEGRIGAASKQVEHFINRANKWGDKYPEAKEYAPPSIL
jgi:adenylosuccinate lyase